MKKSLEEDILSPRHGGNLKLCLFTRIKGSRSDTSNYGPVALTNCVLCNIIMESIIKDNMIEYLNDQLCITKHQHGFMSNRSCLTNLLETLESWTASTLDNPDMIGLETVYLDYAKGF